LKYEMSILIDIQTKNNLVILTHKIDTLIAKIASLKKYKNTKGDYI